jgi:hypothetical protein
MKKLVFTIVVLLGFTFTTIAQDNSKKALKKTETVVKKVGKEGKTVITKTKKTTVVLKKDGTLDKRYKNTTASGVVLKKDGTPDKRYKNNTVKKVVLKKDGTPDRRYKND